MSQQEPSTRLWTRSFIALTVSSLLLFLNLQMLFSSFPSYAKNELHAGDFQLSLVTSVFAFTAIASRFMTAALMKKTKRSTLLYIGLVIAGIMTFLYMLADTFGFLLLLRVGYGIGFGMASTIVPTLVSQVIPKSRMGEGIGYFGLSTSLAMSIGPMIGLNVMKHSGFGTLALIGAITLVFAFPILGFTKAVPMDPGVQVKKASASNAKVPFNSKLLFPAALNAMLAITYGGVLSFLALFGDEVHLGQVGLFFLFNAITIIIVRPISGKLFDRKGYAAVLVPASLCVTVSLALLSYATTMPMLIVSALLYGLGFGAIQPSLQAWMLRTSTPAQYGMANSMFYNTTDLGVAVGALVLGAISAASDYASMYRFSAGIMALFLVVFIIVHMRVRSSKANATA
ncbi:MFS transporter [Cohnella endophytica]|uniref:MFS transporter n=1 Tax=Cohnella endophytica TaxID=2419778 RepID=A0A494X263_9BACL|nr:MFS transporter [Cohnella endophytica]RKP44807.1 MFS transporter [Cohnella endophytica]